MIYLGVIIAIILPLIWGFVVLGGENKNNNLAEGNRYLEQGWMVKSVTMHHTQNSAYAEVTAIFVLEKF